MSTTTEERKIVLFPAPPPTTNALSAAQRMRLVRSSKKLGRILGITPHFVDCHGVEEDAGPLGPFAFDDMSLRSSSRASMDSHFRSSSLSSRASTDSASSTTSSFTSTSTSSTSSRKSLPAHDTWPARKPPMLRLALAAPPDLESIPASPVTPRPRSRPRLMHRRTPPLDGSPSSSPSSSPSPPASLCTNTDTDTEDPESPHPSPTFTIPHPAAPSMRRAKMERLRRTLGEGVPLRLVFPPSPSSDSGSEEEEEGSEPSLSLSSGSRSTSEESLHTPGPSPVSESLEEEKDLPRVPHSHMRSTSKLSTRRRKKSGIAYTRDSMVEGGSSPHRAPRVVVPLPSPGLVASRPAPPPPPGSKVRRRGSVLRKPVPFYLAPAPLPKDKHSKPKPTPNPKKGPTNPPIVPSHSHPRSRSHSSGSHSRLDVIPESPLEKSSEWFGDEDGFDFEYVGEEEVLEAAMWGWGYAGVMEGDVGGAGYGMGRGLARSYGRV